MNDTKRLELIAEAVRYCQRVAAMGMPSSCYTKALREPIHFLWERRVGSKFRVARYRSKNAVGLKAGSRQIVFDHAVPFNYCQKELLKLEDITPDSVRAVLEKFNTIVLITQAEDARLKHAGLNHAMPPESDGTDVLARYKAVGIVLVDNAQPSAKLA